MRMGVIGLMALAVVSVFTTAGNCTTYPKSTAPSEWDDPLLYGHLVIHGTVEEVSRETIRVGEWTRFTRNPDRQMQIARVRISVLEVLKGVYEDGVIDLVLNPYQTESPQFTVGTELVVSTHLVAEFLGGMYTPKGRHGVFELNDGRWVRQSDGHTMTLEQIKGRVASADIVEVARGAELIVVGTVLSKREREIPIGDGAEVTATVEEYTLKVNSILKGSADERTTTLVIMTKGGYFPAWRTYVPLDLVKGETWYAFLKRDRIGYYPYAGLNGLLKVEGNALIYDRTVKYPLSKATVDKIVAEGVYNER